MAAGQAQLRCDTLMYQNSTHKNRPPRCSALVQQCSLPPRAMGTCTQHVLLLARLPNQTQTLLQGVEESKASNLKAAGTIFIAVVGAGVLGLPYAFSQVQRARTRTGLLHSWHLRTEPTEWKRSSVCYLHGNKQTPPGAIITLQALQLHATV